MLKIHKKLKIPLLLIMISLGGIFLFQYLTFIPEYSHAKSISTEDPIKTIDNITYMQDMAPEICANTTTPAAFLEDGVTINSNVPEKQLIDRRDGKTYWIAKLADGNCWMTQNLDYDDPNSTRITSTGGINGGPSSNDWENDNTVRQYWDPGEKIVSGSKLAVAGDDTDRHLLVGNYYSWLSATNGTGSSVAADGVDASGSICPEGWRLPTSTSSGEFQALVNKGESGWVNYPNTNIPGYWLGGTSATANGVAFFSTNGYVIDGALDVAGSRGCYWSSNSGSPTSAYYLNFVSSLVNPSFRSLRYHGNSVRCVSKGASDSITPTPDDGINDPNISVNVPNIITLEVTDSVTMENTTPNTINTQEFTATVTSNANYSLNLNATNTDAYATSLVNIKDDHMIGHIDSVSSPSTTLDSNQWGIKACSSLLASCDSALFQPLPTKDQNPDSINPFFTSTPGSNTHLFQIGINPSSSLPSGTYSTSIQVTASTSD